MRSIPFSTVFACLFAPSIASAALTLNVPEVGSFRPGQTGFIDVFFTETGPATNERLAVYAIGLDLLNGSGVTFGPAPFVRMPGEEGTPGRRWVFADVPGATLEDLGSGPDRIRAFASLPISVLDGVDITPNNSLVLRVPYTISPTAGLGVRDLVINTVEAGATDFVDEVGELIPFVPDNGKIEFIPEPGAVGLLGGGGVFLLLRRRGVSRWR
jgi:hypothetical protein